MSLHFIYKFLEEKCINMIRVLYFLYLLFTRLQNRCSFSRASARTFVAPLVRRTGKPIELKKIRSAVRTLVRTHGKDEVVPTLDFLLVES